MTDNIQYISNSWQLFYYYNMFKIYIIYFNICIKKYIINKKYIYKNKSYI